MELVGDGAGLGNMPMPPMGGMGADPSQCSVMWNESIYCKLVISVNLNFKLLQTKNRKEILFVV